MLYHQSILSRSEDELIRRVYEEQKLHPVRGDWITQLKEDFEFIGENFTEEYAKRNTQSEYKSLIKQMVRSRVFDKLEETQSTRTKVSDICYNTFTRQEYRNSHELNNHKVSILFSLRSRTFKSVKNNFGMQLNCSLGCLILENQEHWLCCKHTTNNNNTQICYDYLYGSLEQQIEIVQLYSKLEEEREELTAEDAPSSPVAHTGLRPAPGP